jgi:hypothetical protein
MLSHCSLRAVGLFWIKKSELILRDVQFDRWESYACEKANRNLSCREWNFYFGSERPVQARGW